MITETPVCPSCGHKENDAWEINFGDALDGDAQVSCNECGVTYFCERIVSVSYRSTPLAAEKEANHD